MTKHAVLAIVLAAGCKAAGMTPEMRTDIQAKVQSAQTPIQECYQRQLTVNRKLRGMMVLTFAADGASGKFQEITLRRDEPQDPVLKFCVIQELAKLSLTKPPGSRVVIDSYPIKFDWANP